VVTGSKKRDVGNIRNIRQEAIKNISGQKRNICELKLMNLKLTIR